MIEINDTCQDEEDEKELQDLADYLINIIINLPKIPQP